MVQISLPGTVVPVRDHPVLRDFICSFGQELADGFQIWRSVNMRIRLARQVICNVSVKFLNKLFRVIDNVRKTVCPQRRQPNFLALQALLQKPQDSVCVIGIVVSACEDINVIQSGVIRKQSWKSRFRTAAIDKSGKFSSLKEKGGT